MKELNGPRVGRVQSSTRLGDGHTVRWTEWGDTENGQVLFCAHGLSRSGRDFDFLAHALQQNYRVICADYPGRGSSDWLGQKTEYHNEQYLRDSLAIIDAISFDVLDWVGTSMGGLIGMALAARPDNPVRKMVINDVGPFIPASALQVIGEYLGQHPHFASLEQAHEYYRTVYASFGKLEDHHYAHFVEHGTRPHPGQAGYLLNYDPAIIDQFVDAKLGDIDLWDVFDQITTPMLILRGAKSGLLLPQTVEQMKYRHGNAESVEFADCAHAPSLMVEEQINTIRDWLY